MSRCGVLDHCCWLEGEVCKYLEESESPDYKWACSLRRIHGDWAGVYNDERYTVDVKPKLVRIGYDLNCGDWPPDGMKCNACGEGS